MIEDPAFAVRVAVVATLGLLGFAAIHDLGFRTVPNAVPAGLLACGVLRHVAQSDLPTAMLPAAVVLIGAYAVWRFGLFGGADAKLLGATALVLPQGTVAGFILGTALAGGALALSFLALGLMIPRTAGPRPHGLLARAARAEAWRLRRRGPLPYAVAIAAGAAAFLQG
jgi:prepilin peptidase CpaA